MPAIGAAYGRVAQLLHWLTAVLVLVAFLVSVGGPESRVYSAAHATSLVFHESLGASVFVLTCLRLLWRRIDPPPPPAPMPAWMHVGSRCVHWALYSLLIATPMAAIVGAWTEGHAVTPFGLAIAPMLAESKPLGAEISDLHGLFGDAIMWIAGLHAAAAIYHQVWLRDGLLARMVPWRLR